MAQQTALSSDVLAILERFDARNKKLDDRYAAMDDRNKQLNELLKCSKERNVKLDLRIAAMDDRNKRLDVRNADLSKLLKESEQHRVQMDATWKKRTAELNALLEKGEKRNERMQKRMLQLEVDNKKLRLLVKKQAKEIDELKAVNNKLVREVDLMRSEMERFHNDKAAADDAVRLYKSENSGLWKDMKRMNIRMGKLEEFLLKRFCDNTIEKLEEASNLITAYVKQTRPHLAKHLDGREFHTRSNSYFMLILQNQISKCDNKLFNFDVTMDDLKSMRRAYISLLNLKTGVQQDELKEKFRQASLDDFSPKRMVSTVIGENVTAALDLAKKISRHCRFFAMENDTN